LVDTIRNEKGESSEKISNGDGRVDTVRDDERL
jgi:hypothetical protein